MERTKGKTTMRLRYAFVGMLFAAAVAGCGGGGGGGGTNVPTSTPTSAPTANGQGILLYEVASSGGTSPINQPSPGQLGVTNLSIPFTELGQDQAFVVQESGFSGTFTFTLTACLGPSNVTIYPSSGAGPDADFIITATAAGICTVKVSDGTNLATVLVDVTTTAVNVSGIKRN
jgi:hypothetical protein